MEQHLPWTFLPRTVAARASGSPSWGMLCPRAPKPERGKCHWPRLRCRTPSGRGRHPAPFAGLKGTHGGSPACTCCQDNGSTSASGKAATRAGRRHQSWLGLWKSSRKGAAPQHAATTSRWRTCWRRKPLPAQSASGCFAETQRGWGGRARVGSFPLLTEWSPWRRPLQPCRPRPSAWTHYSAPLCSCFSANREGTGSGELAPQHHRCSHWWLSRQSRTRPKNAVGATLHGSGVMKLSSLGRLCEFSCLWKRKRSFKNYYIIYINYKILEVQSNCTLSN